MFLERVVLGLLSLRVIRVIADLIARNEKSWRQFLRLPFAGSLRFYVGGLFSFCHRRRRTRRRF